MSAPVEILDTRGEADGVDVVGEVLIGGQLKPPLTLGAYRLGRRPVDPFA